jgi:hypothetical protein
MDIVITKLRTLLRTPDSLSQTDRLSLSGMQLITSSHQRINNLVSIHIKCHDWHFLLIY